MQNFMWDLVKGCTKLGIQVPRMTPVPDSLIVWHNPNSNFPGETMVAAFEAAKGFFKRDPDIIFVILPERGAHFTTAQLPFKSVKWALVAKSTARDRLS